ncbi:MAG: RnfABCDGE type electron transport complex subunit B [Sedimentisphaerales bacterium]|nr:RnfABCDGE type electron transport complex subunit B [Sedimentisphaerales bacterium]HNY77908.1 RnfABCDGE type electron transport complex subunit B [Sedimentisphaerales bacterium]HOC63304.1 RnfABCDGE type electron transport complex subunit B [Sedimentisphaerales bacterium]HPY51269.1 RnfABCDGE type electron transport complex subunit B [Sedimentisphaerales bacterium]HQA90008.1 RnfABCDGE type electron transport complex subunit B [Sedimentisphaerales bacterium]
MLTGVLGAISGVWLAGLIMLGLGLVFAIVLLVASEKLKVPVDPRITQVYEVLPHLDCGACGYPGCSGYAKAVIANPELLGQCAPGGADAASRIAAILNLRISASGPAKRPIVHCRAHTADRTYFAQYQGIPSCTAANALANAQACKFGCLGFGDCVRACKFDALHVIDGLSTVDYTKCTGCGACSKACPRNLIEMVPFSHENMMTVACRSRENGKSTRAFCQVGCIGCGLCAKQSEAFTVADNLARMDYAKYAPCGENEAAMNKCPTGVIVCRGKTAPPPREPKAKSAEAAKG